LKKIFILLPGPLTQREYIRFGVKTLEKEFLVKTLSLTPWLFPKFYKSYSTKSFYSENNITINSEKDFLNLLNNTFPDIIIDGIGYKKNKKVKKIINNNGKSLFIDLFVNSVPWSQPNIHHYIKKKFKKLVFSPNKFFNELLNYIINKFYSLTRFKSDIGIVGGLFNLNIAKKNSRKLIHAHSTDYDIYLDIKDKPINKKNPYAVFIDQSNTYDFDIFNLKSPYNDEYYDLLVKFFKKLEKETKLSVIFAAHPKTPSSIIKKFPNLLKGTEYQIGNTAELIKNSNLVLLHHSTAFNFVTLFNKPSVFLTSNVLRGYSNVRPRIEDYAKSANSKIINMDNDLNKLLDIKILSKIDEGAYKNFIDQHIKMPNSSNIPLWEIVTRYLKNY